MRMVAVIDYEIMKYVLRSGIGSFEPLAAEPQVAYKFAKGAKNKGQTQGNEEYGERENYNRRNTAPFISPNCGPCCPT